MAQKHDVGWKKRNRPQENGPAKISTSRLAEDLVRRGLASPLTLDRNHKPAEQAQP